MLKYHIQTLEATSGAVSDFTFTNIPQDYDDLEVTVSYRFTFNNTGWYDANMLFNGSTSNYTQRVLYGTGSAVAALTETTGVNIRQSDASNTANTFGSARAIISNYTKPVSKTISVETVGENNATKAFAGLQSALWSDNSAITSINVVPVSSTMTQYSSLSLYGIKHGTSGEVEVASGGEISYSGGYTIHTFNSSGTFVANRDMDVEYLVIAGGAGAAGYNGGGGGAGGYRCSVSGESSGGGASAESSLSVAASTSYAVTVGAGGAGGNNTNTSRGVNGTNSSFASIVSVGGGTSGCGSGTLSVVNGSDGGSGGGAGGATGVNATPTSGVANQGYGGGDNFNSGGYGTGGGGGAGSAGGNGTTSASGNGGSGVSSSITGSAVARAGGGGGGAAVDGASAGTASAGGGNGGSTGAGSSATANTGGGGGGGYHQQNGGAGGSGVVIIRYLTPA